MSHPTGLFKKFISLVKIVFLCHVTLSPGPSDVYLGTQIYHPLLGVRHTEVPLVASLHAIRRVLGAVSMGAPLAADIGHALLGV